MKFDVRGLVKKLEWCYVKLVTPTCKKLCSGIVLLKLSKAKIPHTFGILGTAAMPKTF